MPASRVADAYDGVPVAALAAAVGATSAEAWAVCASTMDLAHDAAARGAPGGHVVVADRQDAGRGRGGKAWASESGAGVWASVVLRDVAPLALGVLSLRVGLALATHPVLRDAAAAPLALKWPNDLFVGSGKLAGVLVEVRWRGTVAEWVVVGVGCNVRAPTSPLAGAGLRAGCSRVAVLGAIVDAVRAAGTARAALDDAELVAWAAHDRMRGRRIVAPVAGVVAGIDADGALRVVDSAGTVQRAVAGSHGSEEE